MEIPYAVLINENSASSSEIFASAVQDNKCAALIGKNTYGKGIVQSSWALRNGQGYIKLTTDVYRTPNGKLIHEIGVAPDIEVEQDAELVNYDIFFIMRDFANRDLQLIVYKRRSFNRFYKRSRLARRVRVGERLGLRRNTRGIGRRVLLFAADSPALFLPRSA